MQLLELLIDSRTGHNLIRTISIFSSFSPRRLGQINYLSSEEVVRANHGPLVTHGA